MKRTHLILLIMVASIALKAQTTWGIKAGAGLVDIAVLNAGDHPVSYTARPTYFGGAYINQKFTTHIGMSGELIYIDKGAKFDDATIHLHYINMPVLFNYYFVDGKLRMEGGPEVGYLVSADDFWSNDFDIGVDFGVAYSITSKINLGVRSNLSFSDVASVEKRDVNNYPDGEVSYRNRSAQLYVGYCITCN
jgi:hypothetical protein